MFINKNATDTSALAVGGLLTPTGSYTESCPLAAQFGKVSLNPFQSEDKPEVERYEVIDSFTRMLTIEAKQRGNSGPCVRRGSLGKRGYGTSEESRESCIVWLQNVTRAFGFAYDTYFESVNVLDRFLSKVKISSPRQLKLVVTSAFFLGCKNLEERERVPALQDIVGISRDLFSCNDVKRMESIILSKLNFELWSVTSLDFLVTFAASIESKSESLPFAKFDIPFSEVMQRGISCLHVSLGYQFLEYPPSMQALCALLISLQQVVEVGCYELCKRTLLVSLSDHGQIMGEDFYCCLAEMKFSFEDHLSQKQ